LVIHGKNTEILLDSIDKSENVKITILTTITIIDTTWKNVSCTTLHNCLDSGFAKEIENPLGLSGSRDLTGHRVITSTQL